MEHNAYATSTSRNLKLDSKGQDPWIPTADSNPRFGTNVVIKE